MVKLKWKVRLGREGRDVYLMVATTAGTVGKEIQKGIF
jgi:hypothetical protein